MKRNQRLGLTVAGVLLAGTTLIKVLPAQPSSSTRNAKQTRNYDLTIKGTPGVRLNLLLISKPTTRGGPERLVQQKVTVPFSKTFSATSCYAWLDELPGQASGKVGSQYRAVLKSDDPSRAPAQCSGTLEAHDGTSSFTMGDL